MKAILIFVDGLGLGANDPAVNPCLDEGIQLFKYYEKENGVLPAAFHGKMIPTDVSCGVEGIPQSATGQTTLLTGINASQILGRHRKGFPDPTLREILKNHSILLRLKEAGKKVAFVNAYRPLFFQLKETTKWKLSATTVATLAADLPFFSIEDIVHHRAIYHDFTNATLIAQGFQIPPWTPEEAGENLAKISQDYDFILYEYFLTDRAGHSQNRALCVMELRKLESFVLQLLKSISLDETLVVLTSDHGNIEDVTTSDHTRNRVMTFVWGPGSDILPQEIHDLTQISPTLYHFLCA